MTAPPRPPAGQAARDLSPATRDALARYGLADLEHRAVMREWEALSYPLSASWQKRVVMTGMALSATRAAAEAALAAERERGDER